MYSKLGMSVFLILAWAISVHAERMCNDVAWRKCSDPAARSSTGTARSSTSGDFTSEIERNPTLKCAIKRAREYGEKILKLLEKWENYGLDRDDVALIMAYTDRKCGSNTFYDELNQDSNDYGLNDGNYPVTKNKLRKALLSMEKAMTFPSQLHRKERIQFLDKYKDVVKSSDTLELTTFTSTSDTQCVFQCKDPFFNVIYQNPSHGVNISEFSYYAYEREWLLPAYIGVLTFKSINEDKDPVEVIVEGPKQKSCNSAYMFSLGSKDYMLVCFFSSLVMALFTHLGIISIG